jgi:ubiquinone biosynthesis protein UbiJ
MPEYRTPLPGLLAGMLETGVNRVLDLDERTAQRLENLDGKRLQLDLEGTGISLYFAFSPQHIGVSAHSDDPPDTRVSGTPRALFEMAAPEELGRWGSAGSPVTISGDATLARDLERLFSRLDPDWEGGLSRLFGDVLGYQVASGLRSGLATARDAAAQAGGMLNEYLQNASGPVARNEDLRRFSEAVEDTRRAVDDLERQVARLECEADKE